jgi:hypothetical protein
LFFTFGVSLSDVNISFDVNRRYFPLLISLHIHVSQKVAIFLHHATPSSVEVKNSGAIPPLTICFHSVVIN